MYDINFDYRGGGGLSWMQWEDLMRERVERAKAIDGLAVQVHTGATMTPYDPSAGGTQPIMYYLRHGWEGERAAMKPRWPPGTLREMMGLDRPYEPHLPWVTRWILFGKGDTLPRDTTYEIWNDMAQWIESTLFQGRLTPTAQWQQYRREGHGFYGYRGTRDPRIINPWEKHPADDAETKRKASAPAKFDSRFADVYRSRGPGFLASMWDIGPVVKKP